MELSKNEISKIAADLHVPIFCIHAISKERAICLVTREWLDDIKSEKFLIDKLEPLKLLNSPFCKRLLMSPNAIIPDNIVKVTVERVHFWNKIIECMINEELDKATFSSSLCHDRFIEKEINALSKPFSIYKNTFGFGNFNCLLPIKKEHKKFMLEILEMTSNSKHHLNSLKNVQWNDGTVLKEDCFYMICESNKYTLSDVFQFTPDLVSGYLLKIFITYQLLNAICDLHLIGFTIGDVNLSNISCDERCWIKLRQPSMSSLFKDIDNCKDESNLENEKVGILLNATRKWQYGILSNLDYLLLLNELAGRRWNDPNYHPIIPWITDFNSEFHIRDLKKSKYRLNKGDDQLDINYTQALERGDFNAHHIPETLSDITYYVYKARITPKEILCKHVREKWVPNEYPLSMTRIYSWTPDECIPEFYMDSSILISIHEDLPSLELPVWCSNGEEFIKWHRSVLESDTVSESLHHWIDITFGYKLDGDIAVKEKNLCLQFTDKHLDLRNFGIVQLFRKAHPQKFPKFIPNQILQPDWIKLELLQRFETNMNFYELFQSTSLAFCEKQLWKMENFCLSLICKDMQCLACLIIEIYCWDKICIGNTLSFEERFCLARKTYLQNKARLPSTFSRLLDYLFVLNHVDLDIKVLKYGNLFEYKSYYESTPGIDFLLEYMTLFPNFIINYHKIFQQVETIANNEAEVVKQLKLLETFFIQHSDLTNDESVKMSISLVLPYINHPKLGASSAWILFNPIACCLQKKYLKQYLLKPILNLFINSYTTTKHVKLYHRSFFVQLSARFGLKQFLESFIAPLVEAVAGNRDFVEYSEEKNDKTEELHETENKVYEEETFAMDENLMDNSESYTEKEDNIKTKTTTKNNFGSKKFNISDIAAETLQWLSHRLGPVLTAKYLSRNLLCMLSLCYFTHLLEVTDELLDESKASTSRKRFAGDEFAFKLTDCLADIVVLYGEQVVILQYFPYFSELIKKSADKLTSRNESALIASITMLQHILPYLSDVNLSNELQRIIIGEYILPCVELLVSENVHFPSSSKGRQALAYRVIDVLFLLSSRLGSDLSRQELFSVLSMFFNAFSCRQHKSMCLNDQNSGHKRNRSVTSLLQFLSKKDDEEVVHYAQPQQILQELDTTFDFEMAYYSYKPFCKLLGKTFMDDNLKNSQFLQELCDKFKDNKDLKEFQPKTRTLSIGTNVSFIGNKINIQKNENEFQVLNFNKQKEDMLINNQRHLKDQWLAYWSNETSLMDRLLDCNQIKLQTFSGHTNAIKDLCILDNENSMLSASRDRTVKVWSVRNCGGGEIKSNCQATYSRHTKSIFFVDFLSTRSKAISCDGIIHEWDPFLGSQVRNFQKFSNVIVVCKLPEPSQCLLTATTDGYLRFVDFRTSTGFVYSLKCSNLTTNTIRSMDVNINDSNLTAVGHNNGLISVLDIRSGIIGGIWKGHDAEILQVKSLPYYKENKSIFATSSMDSIVNLWRGENCKIFTTFKALSEPAHCLDYYNEQLVCFTPSNKILIQDQKSGGCNLKTIKLGTDMIKGQLTIGKILKMNRLFMLGSDSGCITMIA